MAGNHKLVCARAARQEFREAFCRGIKDYRNAKLAAAILGPHLAEKLPDEVILGPFAALWGLDIAQFAWDGSVSKPNADACHRRLPFRIMARKRPVHPHENEAGLYDSISVEGMNCSAIVHDGRVHRDGRTLYMVHSRFCLDRIFGETESNADVYEEAARPLVQAFLDGGRATLMMFGQTGTGKTYTASGVMHHLAQDVFTRPPGVVTILVYELAGSRGGREGCFDLLAERKQVKCLTGEDGQVHIRGARAIQCTTAEEFLEAVKTAFAWRSSESTERNEASSRSHAIVEIHLEKQVSGDASSSDACASSSTSTGVLRVVDLAGSERNYETQQHTRAMAERGGHINYSLLMLKECARIMHRNKQLQLEGRRQVLPPFRSARLTQLLRSCFTDESHQTVVIATLSPSPTDVEHTLNSLQHVGMMREGRQTDADRQAAEVAMARRDRITGFSEVDGRGHGLHSKLQDARKTQLNLHAFDMVTLVGGSIQKKYDAHNLKTEAFIDPRWHREMNVEIEESDLWVLKEANDEVVQVLTAWREEQWQARKAQDLAKWDASAVQDFIASLNLPGEARIPSTMTGAQLRRLGKRGVAALCSDEASAEALHAALQGQKMASEELMASQRAGNKKLTALGTNKVYAALDDTEL